MNSHVSQRRRSETCRVTCRVWCRDRSTTGRYWPCPEPAGHSEEHAAIEAAVYGQKPAWPARPAQSARPTELHCYQPAAGPASDCDETLEEKLRASIAAARVVRTKTTKGKETR